MRLAKFILANLEPILPQWEAFARSLLPGASLTIMQLRGCAELMPRATARDMQDTRSLQDQEIKGKGGGAASYRRDIAFDMYGVERASSDFHITEAVSEYRALCASVLRLCRGAFRNDRQALIPLVGLLYKMVNPDQNIDLNQSR